MNPNTQKPGHLFFTPRTPWGTRAGQQTFRQHQRACEDAPQKPNKIQSAGKAVLDAGKSVVSAVMHGRPFFGTDTEKARGEKPASSVLFGWHMGAGEPSTGENEKELRDQFISAQHGQFVDRSLRDQTSDGQGAAERKSPEQMAAERHEQMAQKTYAEFLKNQKLNKPGYASP